MLDKTEPIRRQRLAEINSVPGNREGLEARYGQVWNTDELRAAFDVLGFMAPLVVVSRRSDGAQGSLEFQHDPRFYFNWQADNAYRAAETVKRVADCFKHNVENDARLAAEAAPNVTEGAPSA